MGVLESLSSYDKLLNTEYLIKMGRKGKAGVLCLVFDKVDWFHTMGLHYLKDLEFLNVHGAQTESLYDEIIAGTYENAESVFEGRKKVRTRSPAVNIRESHKFAIFFFVAILYYKRVCKYVGLGKARHNYGYTSN